MLALLLALALGSPSAAQEADGPGWDRRGGSGGWTALGWLRRSRDSFQYMMHRLAERSAELHATVKPEDRPNGPPGGPEPDWPAEPAVEPAVERRRIVEPVRNRPGERSGELWGRAGPQVKEWHRSWPPPCRKAGVPVEGGGWYVVAPGDTLRRIAQLHYGSDWGWRRILHANWAAISDPDLIYACQRLFIPRWREDHPACDDPWWVPSRPVCDDLPPRPDRGDRPGKGDWPDREDRRGRPDRVERPSPAGCSRCGAGTHVGERGWR